MENNTNPIGARPHTGNHNLPTSLSRLIEVLLTDVTTDVELVARELCLREAMLERLRRALDRLECAHTVLGALESWMQISSASTPDGHVPTAAVNLLAVWKFSFKKQRPPHKGGRFSFRNSA
jgi:hypothetical protein